MSEQNTQNIPAGWYPDPLTPGGERWWDGHTWGGTSDGTQLVPGWYPDPGTGKVRRWDGQRWGEYQSDRKPVTPKKHRISQGGGVLTTRPSSRRWIKAAGVVALVALLIVGGAVYLQRGSNSTTTTTTSNIGYQARAVNPTMGTMYGSTAGLLTVSQLPNGITKYRCIDGTIFTNGPGETIESPCVHHATIKK